jgi:hypothetical protein
MAMRREFGTNTTICSADESNASLLSPLFTYCSFSVQTRPLWKPDVACSIVAKVQSRRAERLGARRRGLTGKQISPEQVRAMAVFIAESEQWFDCNAVAHTTELPGSTIRHLLFTFFKMGLLDRLEVFGGYRYRLSPTAQGQTYFERLQEAAAVMQPWSPSELTPTSAAAIKQAG